MPLKAIDFSKTIIYKIWKDDDFYIGSTTDFASRKKRHKHSCNNADAKDYNFKLYQTIREKGGWNEWQMTPLEEYDCQNKTQARIREEYWRVKLNASLNMCKAYCSEEERKAQKAQYYQKHAEELRAKNAQYYQENAEEMKAKHAQYYQDHKDELKAKYECECGGKYTHIHKTRHLKSLKHQAFLSK